MKHGIAFRKLSRTSSHRMLMLRNLVSSLLEHEQIKTTLPKAKEAARMAEKIIGLGKRGGLPARQKASSFLLNPTKTVPLLFGQYAERYRERPGGFTRIHKFGHRQGDHAPHAILELCDSPRDLKFEMVARAVGRETVQRWIKTGGKPGSQYMNESSGIMDKPWIRETTKINYGQLMKYASEERKVEFENRAIKWANQLLAEAQASDGLRRPAEPQPDAHPVGLTVKHVGRRHNAGERLAGMSDRASTLGIAAGSVGQGRSRRPPARSVFDTGVLAKDDRAAKVTGGRTWRSPFWEGGWKDSLNNASAVVAPTASTS